MKRFIIKTAFFLALIACVDFISGHVFDYLQNNAKGGMTFRDHYICNELKTDVLLCGSSRCVHHLNPQIITDSMGMSSYNLGLDGNGIILMYGRLQMIRKHTTPKLVIYDIAPEFDLLKREDNHKYLTLLKPYYDNKEIRDVLLSVDSTEQYKMLSNMYRYNSHFLEMMSDYMRPVVKAKENGFVPLLGDLDKSKIRRDNVYPKEYEFDPLKLYYLEKMADSFGKKIVFCVSPYWYGKDTRQFAPIVELCKKRGLEFIDFSNSPKYLHNNSLFKDGNHLNSRGADEFTKDLIKELRARKVISASGENIQ